MLLVINHINNGGGNGGSQGGIYPSLACSPQLLEASEFATEFSQFLELPDDSSAVKLSFQTPQFDFASKASIRDAFEIEVTDLAGNPLAFSYLPDRDAQYNWSEDLEPLWAGTQTITLPAGQDSSATINLNGLAAGTQVRVSARLVNNDADDATSVIIRGFEVVDAAGTRPAGVAGSAGRDATVAPLDMSQLSDISGSFSATYGRTTLIGDNNALVTDLVVTNRGNQTVTGRIIVAIDNISELEAAAMQPDGRLPDGSPYFDLTHEMAGQPLKPGDSLRSREIRFKNDSGQRFTYKLRTLGTLNVAPSGFSSTPITSIEAGKSYKYTAVATDPDGQSLTYTILVGPESAEINAQTGQLSWDTNSVDIGSHQIIVQAIDPYGLSVQQSFTVQVLASLQNRPPNFVSDPVTEAIASSGFEITTVGVGDSPAAVAVIGGFRGPRLVTANASDQTIGVYAGENNDRFDHETEVATGHPKRNGQWVDAGSVVDFGFPIPQIATDAYDIASFDQGDFNGDGAAGFCGRPSLRFTSR